MRSFRGRRALDLFGQRFGMLSVIARAETPQQGPDRGKVHWACKCDCGCFTAVTAYALRQGSALNCGCVEPETPKRSPILRELITMRATLDRIDLRDEQLRGTLHRIELKLNRLVAKDYPQLPPEQKESEE